MAIGFVLRHIELMVCTSSPKSSAIRFWESQRISSRKNTSTRIPISV